MGKGAPARKRQHNQLGQRPLTHALRCRHSYSYPYSHAGGAARCACRRCARRWRRSSARWSTSGAGRWRRSLPTGGCVCSCAGGRRAGARPIIREKHASSAEKGTLKLVFGVGALPTRRVGSSWVDGARSQGRRVVHRRRRVAVRPRHRGPFLRPRGGAHHGAGRGGWSGVDSLPLPLQLPLCSIGPYAVAPMTPS